MAGKFPPLVAREFPTFSNIRPNSWFFWCEVLNNLEFTVLDAAEVDLNHVVHQMLLGRA